MATDQEFTRWHEAEAEAIRAYDEALDEAHRAFREAERRGEDLDAPRRAYEQVMAPARAAFDGSKLRNPFPA